MEDDTSYRMSKKDILEYMEDANPEASYPTGMEDAIIGMVERFGMDPVFLIDKEKVIQILMEDMSREDAEEFFSFNVIGAWMGEGTPCFATLADG